MCSQKWKCVESHVTNVVLEYFQLNSFSLKANIAINVKFIYIIIQHIYECVKIRIQKGKKYKGQKI